MIPQVFTLGESVIQQRAENVCNPVQLASGLGGGAAILPGSKLRPLSLRCLGITQGRWLGNGARTQAQGFVG